jgi:hypothetical protein
MKKLLLLLFVNFFIAFIVQAQIRPRKPFTPNFYDTSSLEKLRRMQLSDSLTNRLRQRKSYLDKMPLAGSMSKRFRYLGNNQKGFEVYQTYQDFMYILKPDSTFTSNMPVLKVMPVTEEKKK